MEAFGSPYNFPVLLFLSRLQPLRSPVGGVLWPLTVSSPCIHLKLGDRLNGLKGFL